MRWVHSFDTSFAQGSGRGFISFVVPEKGRYFLALGWTMVTLCVICVVFLAPSPPPPPEVEGVDQGASRILKSTKRVFHMIWVVSGNHMLYLFLSRVSPRKGVFKDVT